MIFCINCNEFNSHLYRYETKDDCIQKTLTNLN